LQRQRQTIIRRIETGDQEIRNTGDFIEKNLLNS